MDNRYFDSPKQVMFADLDNPGRWNVGIAYKDEIICACCGGIFNIDEVYELADDLSIENAIHPYENWCNIKDEIIGGELPSGLIYNDANNIVEGECDDGEWDEDNNVWNLIEENNNFPAD